MAPRVAALVLFALLATASLGLAATVTQDVAGHHVVVQAAEPGTYHYEQHTETYDSSYDRTSWTNGASVDGQGAALVLGHTTANTSSHSPYGTTHLAQEALDAGAHGNAGGVFAGQQARAALLDAGYAFADGDHAEGRFLFFNTLTYAYGGPAGFDRGVAGQAGAGDLAARDLNPAPTLGHILFAEAAVLASGSEHAGPTALGDQVGAAPALFGGDWNGAFLDAVVWTARCAGNQCAYQGVSLFGVCLGGVRPPFFADCLPSL